MLHRELGEVSGNTQAGSDSRVRAWSGARGSGLEPRTAPLDPPIRPVVPALYARSYWQPRPTRDVLRHGRTVRVPCRPVAANMMVLLDRHLSPRPLAYPPATFFQAGFRRPIRHPVSAACSSAQRARATAAVPASISVAMYLRVVRIAATATVPAPAQGSTISPPGSLRYSIRYSASLTGCPHR